MVVGSLSLLFDERDWDFLLRRVMVFEPCNKAFSAYGEVVAWLIASRFVPALS